MAYLTLKDKDGGRALAELRKRFGAINASVKVGVIDGPADNRKSGGVTNAQLAQWYELGSPGGKIVEHSFLRAAWDHNSADLEQLIVKLAQSVVDGRRSAKQALDLLGQRYSDMVKQFIASNMVEPKTKGGAGTTLQDTTQLRNAITWAVEGTTRGHRLRQGGA